MFLTAFASLSFACRWTGGVWSGEVGHKTKCTALIGKQSENKDRGRRELPDRQCLSAISIRGPE
jgi:hypothetical protein